MNRVQLGGLLLAVGLAGCGGAGTASAPSSPQHSGTSAITSTTAPVGATLRSGVIAQIGPYAVAGASLQRWVDAELRALPAGERPQPPGFDACVAQLEAEPATPEDSQASRAQLQGECRERYREIRRRALERLIAAVWVLEGAHELDANSGDSAVSAQLDAVATRDAIIRTQLGEVAKHEVAAIRDQLTRRTRAVSAGEVAEYYAQHRDRYVATQERRDVQLVGAKTEARALRAKQELAAGKSFAEVVKESGLREADYSSEGLARALVPNVYGEPKLNRAMFVAKPGVLSGPIGTSFGYYVFKVKAIHPASFKPLRTVAASIRSELNGRRRRSALASFRAQWRAKWTAKTSCSSGNVVRGCREFDGSGAGPANELYTLG